MKSTLTLGQQRITNTGRASNSMRRSGLRGLSIGLILLIAFVVLNGGPLYGEGSDDALFIDRDGTVRVKDLKATGTVEANKFEGDGSSLKVESNRALKEALDRKLDKAGGRLEGSLDVNGLVRARTFESTNPFRHRMYPENPIVYQDIFEAKEKGVITKLGNPQYNDTSYVKNPWYGRRIIMYGRPSEKDDNGAKITVPQGYNTVWIRVLGERFNVVHAYFLDGGKEDLGLWAAGWRSGNSYCPDGSLSDGFYGLMYNPPDTRTYYSGLAHQWVPIPVGRAGELALVSQYPQTAGQWGGDLWLSGLAFSKNAWAHALQSAIGYAWGLNGGNGTFSLLDPKEKNPEKDWRLWNSDSLSRINSGTKLTLKVPVVPSGRDKLLYLVEHNNSWNGCMHTGITVEGQPIERFMATYENPFARHWNSKIYNRYIAARIPCSSIPSGKRWLSVVIDMTNQGGAGIHFREFGTHDLDIPLEY